MNEKIILGLPKGSLNNVKRGNTYQLFVDAGYEVRGYESGYESYEIDIVNDPEINAYLTRPQSVPVELNRGMVDIAIVGEDWIKEESVLRDTKTVKIGDLYFSGFLIFTISLSIILLVICLAAADKVTNKPTFVIPSNAS